jgi:hypothetical protein
MKKLAFLFLISTMSIMLNSCSSTMFPNRVSSLDVWIGHTANELMQQMGPPYMIQDDGAGGQIITYVNSAYLGDVNTGIRTKRSYTNIYISNLTISKQRIFYVNKDGIIYHTMWIVR